LPLNVDACRHCPLADILAVPMLEFLQTYKAALTVLIFIATFFAALTIGRLLKRKAGVRLGVLFQLFCLTLAFYAALSFYGVTASWRNHAGAAAFLLSTAFVVALLDRYLWEGYFEKTRRTTIPQFLRQVIALFIYLIALLLVLSIGYNAQSELKGLLAGSGIAAIIIGFATQDLFGGIISGIALQISKPYKVGDWLHIQDRYAEVMEINWRSTRLRTNDGIYLDVPNYTIARGTIVNLHYPTQVHAMRLRVGADYDVPPNRVKDALYRAATSAEGVLPDPPTKVFVMDFADSAVIYEIKFSMGNHRAYNDICDAIRTNIWYEFKRQQITIPFPIRTLHLQRGAKRTGDSRAEARAILRAEPVFNCMDETQLETVLQNSQIHRYGRGERVIQEGDEGDSMFIMLRGTAAVSIAKNGTGVRVGVMRQGDCFGEISLLTGEPRSATVRAESDCEVLEVSKPVMAEVLRESPQCLTGLSELLAKRKLEGEGIVKDATQPHDQEKKESEFRASFLRRLRTVFEL
jgi:small-conductance mechanosensitive channel/CRP-like cAMP-binding protein